MPCSNGGQIHQGDVNLCSPFSYAHLKHHHRHQQPMAAGDEPSPSPSPPLSSVNSSSSGSSSSSVPLPAAAASPASSREFLPALFARLLHARSANTASIQHSILDRSCSVGSDVLSLNNAGSIDLTLASSSCSSSCAAGCCCTGGSGSSCAAAAAAGAGCSSLPERRVSRLAPVSDVPSARNPAQPLTFAEAQPRTSKHADEAAAEQDAPPSPSSLAAAVKCFVRMAGPNHGRNDTHSSNSNGSLKAKSGKKLQLSRSMVQLRSGPAGAAGDAGAGEDGDVKGCPTEPEVFVRRMESSSPTRIKGVRCIGISKSQQLLPKSQQLCGSEAAPEVLETSTGPATGAQDRLSSSSSNNTSVEGSSGCQKHCQQAPSAASKAGTVVSCDAASALRLTVNSSRTGALADEQRQQQQQQQQRQTAPEAAVARVCETPTSSPSKPASPKSPKLLSKSAFTACANAIAAAAAASVRWAELPQRSKQQKQQRRQEQQPQQQQQQQQLAAGSASFTGTAGSMTAGSGALEGSSSCCTSSSSFSSSFRPHPPAGSSPQKQRPGVLLRQASAASATAAAAAGHKSTSAGSPAAAAAAGSSLVKAAAGTASSGSCSSAAGATAGSAVSNGTGIGAGGGVARAVAGGCTPIAVARHCPRDINGQQWQPSQFVQTRRLYEGKIALVLQGYHAPSGRPLALKVYNRSKLDTMERFQLAREVCLHMRSCHPYIASLYAAYKDAAHIYLLMELAPSGNLYQMLMALKVPLGGARRLGEREAVVHVIAPLLSALCYLHDQGIIHRDIKLENVLLTADGCIKLADFGLSIDSRHEVANTRLGTQGYFAPEVLVLPLKSSPFEGKSPAEAAARPSYDCKVDVWSAGVVCFEVLTGRAPFSAETVAKVVEAIMYRKLAYPAHLSPQAVSFLAAALTRNPKLRPTARQLLHHPFIAAFTGAAAAGAAGVLRE